MLLQLCPMPQCLLMHVLGVWALPQFRRGRMLLPKRWVGHLRLLLLTLLPRLLTTVLCLPLLLLLGLLLQLRIRLLMQPNQVPKPRSWWILILGPLLLQWSWRQWRLLFITAAVIRLRRGSTHELSPQCFGGCHPCCCCGCCSQTLWQSLRLHGC